jgi:L-serine dehydratase
MFKTDSIEEMVREAGDGRIGPVVRRDQAQQDGVSPGQLDAQMQKTLQIMRESAREGLSADIRSMSGMTGGQARKLIERVRGGQSALGELTGEACAVALGVAELNAAMGRIVAAPTAGACGILPGVLLTYAKARAIPDSALVEALFTAAGVGRVIAARASISGAEAGCQAECGSASAMAAAALTELMGASALQAAHAISFALMNVMGLVCDPVGGLVEVPCVYRNVMGVVNAISAADMAASGIESLLPADEVIDAMGRVGRAMPASLRETGEGGCASCPSARRAAVPGPGA